MRSENDSSRSGLFRVTMRKPELPAKEKNTGQRASTVTLSGSRLSTFDYGFKNEPGEMRHRPLGRGKRGSTFEIGSLV